MCEQIEKGKEDRKAGTTKSARVSSTVIGRAASERAGRYVKSEDDGKL